MSETVVFGATGAVGSHVLRELVGRGAAVRAFTRDPGRLPGGVEPARGDLDDAATVRAALDGADRVLLCTPNDPRQVERETGVIDAAVAAGVTRLVKISAVVARPGSPSAFADAHGRIEEHLRASGLPSVVLRPGFYMSNLLAAAATIRDTGRFFLPGADAKVAMTDPRDVAAVAAAVLTGDGHEGRTYTVTGPAALTCAEVAVELSAALRRPVEYVGVPDEVARAAMRDAGDRRVEPLAQGLHERGQRLGEVPVAALAVGVPGHHDGAPEALVVVEHRHRLGALLRRQQRRGARDTVGVEPAFQLRPVERRDPRLRGDRHGRSSSRRTHHGTPIRCGGCSSMSPSADPRTCRRPARPGTPRR